MQRADDARSHGTLQANRAADGHHQLPDLQHFRISEARGRQRLAIRRGDTHDGDVSIGILADHFPWQIVPVGESHRHLSCSIYDMGIGENVAVGREDDTRAGTLRELSATPSKWRLPGDKLDDADL